MVAVSSWKHSVRRVLIAQLVIAGLLAVLSGIFQGAVFAIAAGFGGATAITGTLVAAFRIAPGAARPGAGQELRGVYRSAMLKITTTVVLLVCGLVLFRLPPVAVLVGYLGSSIGYVFGRGYGAR